MALDQSFLPEQPMTQPATTGQQQYLIFLMNMI